MWQSQIVQTFFQESYYKYNCILSYIYNKYFLVIIKSNIDSILIQNFIMNLLDNMKIDDDNYQWELNNISNNNELIILIS